MSTLNCLSLALIGLLSASSLPAVAATSGSTTNDTSPATPGMNNTDGSGTALPPGTLPNPTDGKTGHTTKKPVEHKGAGPAVTPNKSTNPAGNGQSPEAGVDAEGGSDSGGSGGSGGGQ